MSPSVCHCKFFDFNTCNFENIHIVSPSGTALTDIVMEGISFVGRVGGGRWRREREVELANRKHLSDSIGKISRDGSETRIEKQPPTVNSHGKLEDRRTRIILPG